MENKEVYLSILETVTKEILKKSDLDELTTAYDRPDYDSIKGLTDVISAITGNLYTTFTNNHP